MLRLRTLGSIALTGPEGNEVSSVLSQPKRCALLAYLAVSRPGGFQRRDTLLALFWPERDETRARNSLSQSLFFLRQHLPDDAILNKNGVEVGVNPGVIRTDVQEFEEALAEGRWAEALDHYRGAFLQGFHVGEAWEFEEWMERERERLRERASGAAWSLAQEQLERGSVVEAERTAQRAMDLVYTDESPVRKFIEALARAGDSAAALNFYERFSTRLREKLDLEPSAQTAQVAEEIRNGELAKRPEAPRGGPGPSLPDRDTAAPSALRESEPGISTKARRWSAGSLGLLAVAAVAFLGVWLWPMMEEDADRHDLVVVAPFQNRTGDAGFEDLGASLASGIQSTLAKAGIGEAVPFPVVEEALAGGWGEGSPFEMLAGEAGAGVVVTGDIFLRGDSLHIQTYCIDGRTREALHPIEPLAGLITDEADLAVGIQERVAAVLAQHFDTAFAMDPRLTPPPKRLEAYQEYRRGYEILKLGGALREAIDHFHRAWQLDSTYVAPPLRILAYASNRPSQRGEFESVLGALESYRRRMTRFQRHYFDGIRLSNTDQQELAYREFLAMAELGRHEAASSLAEMALLTNHIGKSIEAAGWLDKGNGEFLEPYVRYWQGYWSLYTYALHLDGRYEKQLEIAREWQAQFPTGSQYPIQSLLSAQVGLGQLDGIEAIVEDWRAEKRLQAIWDLADELRVHGHHDAARSLLEGEVERFETDSSYIGRFNNQAMVLHRLGRNEEAHELWEMGVNLEKAHLWAWGVGRVGFSAALAGDTAQAREMERLLMSLENLPPADEVYVPFLRAKIAAALGEKDRAVRILEEWGRSGQLLFWLNNLHRDFTLQSLLGDFPPFQELMRPKE